MSSATALLLPGNMCDSRLWGPIRALFTSACDVDLSRDDSIAAMAERALDTVAGPLLPVGFSMGGIAALEMARRAPERLVGLVLLDTNASADLPERAAARPRQQAEVAAGRLEEIVVGELKPAYLARANRSDGALLALLRDMALALGPDVFVRQSEALRTRADLRAVIPTLDVPLFLGCGEEDRLCPPQWHEAMAGSGRRATLHVFAGAGHMLPLEQPEALRAALKGWMAQNFEDLQ